MKRRVLCAGLATLPFSPVQAQPRAATGGYPTQPIKLVAPYPPGGTVDILSRALAQQLGRGLGQQGLVENRGGAGGTLGAALAAQSAADGYTLLFGAVHHAIAQSTYPKLTYDIRRDFVPVGFLGRVNHVLICSNSLPVKSVQELVAHLKANPGKLNYGTPGSGTLHHLMAEQFKSVTGTTMMHVPYKGSGPAMVDLIAGNIQVFFETMPSALQHVRAGSVRALAVTSRQRSSSLPQVPTIAESGVENFDASSWSGLFAPANTPRLVVSRLNESVNQAFHNPEFTAQWTSLGAETGGGPPEELSKILAAEVSRWAAVVKSTNITVE